MTHNNQQIDPRFAGAVRITRASCPALHSHRPPSQNGGLFFAPMNSTSQISVGVPAMSEVEYRKLAKVERNRRNTEKSKQWRINNPEKYKSQNRSSYAKNKDKWQSRKHQWIKNNPEKFLTQQRRYRNTTRAKTLKAEEQRRRRSRPEVRLVVAMRARLSSAVKAQRACKGKKTMELIGCDGPFLRSYLEFRFKEGMTWSNYGNEWVVDHRIPCASFDLRDVAQQKQCFHYSNLQPMWKLDNNKKSNQMPKQHQAELL